MTLPHHVPEYFDKFVGATTVQGSSRAAAIGDGTSAADADRQYPRRRRRPRDN